MGWLMNDGWQPGLSCDVAHQYSWHGTECAGGTVTRLSLVANGLRGTIPTEIGQLPDLRSLAIEANPLVSGSIPSQIGALRALRSLSIHNNSRISGSLPESLTRLTMLKVLSAHTSSISGTLPDGHVLSRLRYLDLSSNAISGHLPTPQEVQDVEYLSMHTNRISGTLGQGVGRLVHLKDRLYLHRNRLSGSLPSQLGNLTHVAISSLHENLLSGTLPTQLGFLGKLQFPSLSYNRISGSVPSQLGAGIWSELPARLDLMSNFLDILTEQQQVDAGIIHRPEGDITPYERTLLSTEERAVSAWYGPVQSGKCEWQSHPNGRFQCSISAGSAVMPKVDYRLKSRSGTQTSAPHPEAYGSALEAGVLEAVRG